MPYRTSDLCRLKALAVKPRAKNMGTNMVLPAQPSVKDRSRRPEYLPGYSSRAGARRGAHNRRSSLRGKPLERLAGDRPRHGMGTVELPVANLVALAI